MVTEERTSLTLVLWLVVKKQLGSTESLKPPQVGENYVREFNHDGHTAAFEL